MTLILFACIGFIAAILWVDLIFDALVLPHRGKDKPLPEEVLSTMSHFFRRITHRPRLIFVVMIAIVYVIIRQIVEASVPAWVGWTSLILFLTTAIFASIHIMPTARRFGSRGDEVTKQSELAHSLFFLHAFSLAMIVLLGIVQLYAAWGS